MSIQLSDGHPQKINQRAIRNIVSRVIGHVYEYPIMHYFGIPRHTQSMIAYKILTEYF